MLSELLVLPLIFAAIVALMPSDRFVRWSTLIFSLVHFGWSLRLLGAFDKSSHQIQLVEQHHWVQDFGITYFVGIDGISLWLVLLATFLLPLIVLGSWSGITQKVKGFHVSLLVLQSAMIGTFLALDLVLFYVFFEFSLIPMYFIIGIWGGPRRIYASIKFFIFTMTGSVLMLVGIIYLMFQAEAQFGFLTSNLLEIYRLKLPFIAGEFLSPQTLLFFAFALAFAIKVPMFPVHTWLPDAHTEAPTAGSVVLAAVMLKMGTYGFMRFILPLFPEAVNHWSWLFMFLGAVGVVYGALVAMVQEDFKKLVAYSSVSHMGYVVLGLFALNLTGTTGGLFTMLSHGISTGALFLLIGMIYERTHSRQIAEYGGLASVMPLFTIAFFVVTFSSIALPLTNGFVGEFLVLMGAYQANHVMGYIAILGVILGAAYMLWMCKRIFFGADGPLIKSHKSDLIDLNWRERIVMAPIFVMIFWMGIFPNHFLNWSKASLEYLVENREKYELTLLLPEGEGYSLDEVTDEQ